MSDWQPIETAPKDGEYFIVWPTSFKKVGTARWQSDEFAKKPNPYWEYEYSLGKAWNRKFQPTHWMPLPPPPAP